MISIKCNEKASKHYNITQEEFVHLYACCVNKNTEEILKGLEEKKLGKVTQKDGNMVFTPSELGVDIVLKIGEESEGHTQTSLDKLSERLKKIYPSGKKEGTTQVWTDGKKLITKRLNLFFKKYGEFPPEDIIDATQRYVNDMNGSRYMRTLKYFIFKETTNAAGEVESSSELLTYLENKDEDTLSTSWDIEMV